MDFQLVILLINFKIKNDMKTNKITKGILNPISFSLLVVLIGISSGLYTLNFISVPWLVSLLLLSIFIACSIHIADQWEKAVVLRMGKYRGLRGPGVFFIIPIVDRIDNYIDQCIRVTDFVAEQTLTKDTVPVNVDAVVYWTVWDVEKAALEVQEYQKAISYIAQTGLRDIIPFYQDYCLSSSFVFARVILGTAETEIAEKFSKASEQYTENPVALHLRGMNMLFEGLKEKGSMVIVPSSALDSMNLGAMGGLVSLAKTNEEERQ